MSQTKSRIPDVFSMRNSVSAIALAAILPAAPALAEEADGAEVEVSVQLISAATLAADAIETTPAQEDVTSYHGVQGYQLDTANASESGARRIFVSRKRKDGKSVTVIDQGNGVQVSGVNEALTVTPRSRTGQERDIYGYNYRTKALAGPDPVVREFNKILAPRLRAASGKRRDAVWATQFRLSELVGSLVSDATLDLKLDRKFIMHKGKEYVLIGYEIPAFAYKDAAGNDVIHWSSGFVITDPDYSIVYFYGAKNAGTQNAARPNASPLSARLFSFATDETGKRLLDISDFAEAQELIDKATEGATDYQGAVRATKPGALVDTGFFEVARMIDVTATAIGENSGNEAPQIADAGWDQTQAGNAISNTITTVGDILPEPGRVVDQTDNLATVTTGADYYGKFKNFVRVVGTEGSKEAIGVIDDLFGPTAVTVNEIARETGFRVVGGTIEGLEGFKGSASDVANWLENAARGNVQTGGIGEQLTKVFGSNGDDIAKRLTQFGGSVFEGIGKIAGPLAHVGNAYTVYQSVTGDGDTLVGPDTTDFGSQYFQRVVIDVGLGLGLNILTGDVVGLASDSTAIVFKSAADIGRAGGQAWERKAYQALADAEGIDIQAGQYSRTKDLVDTNLPPLLEADNNRTGQDWSKVTRFSSNLPFSWDTVTATGSISTVAADKLSDHNFRLALYRFLQGRNPDVPETVTIYDPPPTTGGGEPDPDLDPDLDPETVTIYDPPPTTRGGDPDPDRDTPGSFDPPAIEGDIVETGTVTSGTADRNSSDESDTLRTGTVTSSTAATRPDQPTTVTPTPKPTPPPGIFTEPREGWYNEYAYDKNGKWIGYRAVYPLAKPQSEGDSYENLFGDVVDADKKSQENIGETSILSSAQLDNIETAKRKAEAQAALDAKYEAARKAKNLPDLDQFESADERKAHYQGILDKQQAERTGDLPKRDDFETPALRKAYYEGVLEEQQKERTKDLPALDQFANADERHAHYQGILDKQQEERTGELPKRDDFKTPELRKAYYEGLLKEQQDERAAGLPEQDTFDTAAERQAYYQAKQDAQQQERSEGFPDLDEYTTPEQRKAAAQAWLDQRFEEKTDFGALADEVDSIIDLALSETIEDAEDGEGDDEGETPNTPRGFAGTPLPGGDYPNQLDYGDGSYPNQLTFDWSKVNPWGEDGKYPNQVDYGDGEYPNLVKLDYSEWDSNQDYPFQIPDGYFQTPYDPDSFNKFTQNNAYKYANISGMIPTNLPAYEEFVKYYGLDALNKMARNAGYANIFAAIEDRDYLIALSKNPGFRKKALSFECNVRFGVNYDCIGLNRQERGQLDLGDLLQESRSFLSEGFTDVTIDSLMLGIFLRDFGLEDNDIVNVMVSQFGQSLFNSNITLTNAGVRRVVNVRKGVVEVKVTAVNTGDIPPNTAEVLVENVSDGEANQDFSQDEGGSSTLRVKVK